MDEKDRFLRAVSGSPVDRAPVVCPGPFWAAPSREAIREGGFSPPLSLCSDPQGLSRLSVFIHERAGVENLGLPFSMRVESRAYGGETEEWPEPRPEPRKDALSETPYPLKSLGEWKKLRRPDPGKDGLLPVVSLCMELLAKRMPRIPVIADISGPLGLATSLIDAKTLLKALVNDPFEVHAFLAFLCANTAEYARSLVDAGATAILIFDPFSTAATLGRDLFNSFALPYINRLTDAAHRMGCPVIVHLCGALKGIEEGLSGLHAECISVDSSSSIKDLKKDLPRHIIMGNLDASVLSRGSLGDVKRETERALSESPHILSPSCGLDGDVAVKNLKAAADLLTG